MKWNLCSDAMPLSDEEVLCYVHSSDGWGSRRIMCWNGLVWHDGGVVHQDGAVTHWCYIDIPQENEKSRDQD